MFKNRFLYLAGAVFLSAAVTVGYFLHTQERDLKPNQVLTWDCDYPAYKPDSITLTCADGGIYLNQIVWTGWSKREAIGTAMLNENLCQPSCAEGKLAKAPVEITLSNPSRIREKFILRTLDMATKNGKALQWGRASHSEWDLMDYALISDFQEE